MEQQI